MVTQARYPASLWVRQARAVFRVYLLDSLTYRAQAMIWMFTDVVGAAMMLLVFFSTGAGRLGGYETRDLLVYYLGLIGVQVFVTCHMQWEIGQEVKDGAMSTFLVRPFSWYTTMLLRNLAWRVVRLTLLAPIFALFLWAYWGALQGARPNLGPEFWASVALGHAVSGALVIAMGLIAFFVEDATAIFETYYLPMLFLSGQIFPVGMLPGWAQNLGKALPFYYTTALPAEIVAGRVAGADAWRGLAIQAAWVGAAYVAYLLTWPRALRRYTGTGM